MSTAGTANWKYDLRYYVECFVSDTPRQHDLLRARTIDGAKEEAERRFPLRAPGDMLRILGVVRSGTYPRSQPVTVAETMFPKLDWTESDEVWWFRMAEDEAELVDGTVSRDEKPRIAPGRIKYVADTLSIGENRIAEFLQDYGDVISETYRVKLITLADAARCLEITDMRLRHHIARGRVGTVIRFPGRCFLRRDKVEAFAERRRKDVAEVWERVERIRREERAKRTV